jgi:LacI family transcriptional regulator
MAALLEQRLAPDAVFVSNIEMLRGALRVLQERGIRVPADLALVSNDRSDWLDLLTVPVSSVEQPTDSMGALAVELLLRRIEQPGRPPEWRELKPEFVIRDSSRKAGGSRRRRSQDP